MDSKSDSVKYKPHLKIIFGPKVPSPFQRNYNFDQINAEQYYFFFLAVVCLEMVCDRKSFYSFAFNMHLCFNDTFSASKNTIVAHRKSTHFKLSKYI